MYISEFYLSNAAEFPCKYCSFCASVGVLDLFLPLAMRSRLQQARDARDALKQCAAAVTGRSPLDHNLFVFCTSPFHRSHQKIRSRFAGTHC